MVLSRAPAAGASSERHCAEITHYLLSSIDPFSDLDQLIWLPNLGVDRPRPVIHVGWRPPTTGKSETPMLSTPPAATAAELTEKRMFMLFPTPMFMGKLPDMSVCDRV